jgi:hypothetical protein
MPVLDAGVSTEPLGVHGGEPETPSTEYVEFSFTDPQQAMWRRRGNGPPERLLDLGGSADAGWSVHQ